MSRARAARARRPDRRGDSSVEVAVHLARMILPRCAQQQGGARGASRLDFFFRFGARFWVLEVVIPWTGVGLEGGLRRVAGFSCTARKLAS